MLCPPLQNKLHLYSNVPGLAMLEEQFICYHSKNPMEGRFCADTKAVLIRAPTQNRKGLRRLLTSLSADPQIWVSFARPSRLGHRAAKMGARHRVYQTTATKLGAHKNFERT